MITRSWNASHGSVYVPVTEKIRPNPYLKVNLRDIDINNDLTLTKINPAFMTRQLSEIAKEKGGVQFHITSLNPIRLENKATQREKAALESFEKGLEETGEIIGEGDQKRYFYMAPLITENSCLKCHSAQGYEEGDIRGGISVTLPDLPLIAVSSSIINYSVIGIAGIIVIFIFGIALYKAYEKVKRQAVFDALTGIHNRHSFSEKILVDYNISRRKKYPLSIIMSDVDFFKKYNDTYGHKAGDECLKRVADCISNTLKRPGDYCARYGGEEFIIILPDTDKNGAVTVAENIRKNIENLVIEHKGSEISEVVTMSLGVATMDKETVICHEELISRADEVLYISKEKGRNMVSSWCPNIKSDFNLPRNI